jgi:carboxylesterase
MGWLSHFLRSGDGDKSAFFAKGQDRRAALCLHGYSGTPFEVRPIAEGLAAQGYTVLAPVLAGHGASLDDLRRTRHDDWLASAAQALQTVSAEVGGGPVAVAGFSLGGLLAVSLARSYPGIVSAMAVMSAPLRLRPLEVAAVRAWARLPRALRNGPLGLLPKSRGFDVLDPEMALRNPSHVAMPLEGVMSLIELGERVRRELPEVTVPTLVMHGARDRTVPLEDSLELAGTVGSTDIERLWLHQSGHLIGIDVERRTVIDAVVRFFNKYGGLVSPAPAASATGGTSA